MGVKRLKQFSTQSKLTQDCVALKLKPITTWSPVFSRAKGFLVFIFNSHWLLVIISCALIGCCDCFGFWFYELKRRRFSTPSFAIRDNLLNPLPSLFGFSISLPSSCLSALVNSFWKVYFQLMINKNDPKNKS